MQLPEDAAVRARKLHERAIVIDCHSDILIPIADGFVRMGTQVDIPDPQEYEPPFEIKAEYPPWVSWPHSNRFGCIGQYSLPQFLAGGLTAQVCAIFVKNDERDRALRRCMEMVSWLHREVKENDALELATSVADIHRLKEEGKCAAIMAFEALEQLGYDLTLLDLFYKLGLRMASLTWSRRNQFADGLQRDVRPGGLTSLGRQAIARMNELGIVIDLAHLNQVCYWEVLELTEDPVVMSHCSGRGYFTLKAEKSRAHPAHDV